MGSRGDLSAEVAQVVLDLSEGLRVGQIDQTFGHLPQPGLGLGAQNLQQSLDAGLTVKNARGSSRSGSI